MKEGLIASSYEYPKCNGRHDVTLWAIKRLLRNRSSHAEGMFATIPLQKKYGGAHTIIHLAMRPLRQWHGYDKLRSRLSSYVVVCLGPSSNPVQMLMSYGDLCQHFWPRHRLYGFIA
ncbi:uncharacterized protein TNCV_2291481 [Trichonephila clavipes]|uniref:Uncharacterized protein n=1 Tax=Trichonephila clavipes TaxID=2585209 RepID=A0A8X6RKK4_TRICX|nr:uncharacterized protein TNCV_2291481 [Trichonephila clavipes]